MSIRRHDAPHRPYSQRAPFVRPTAPAPATPERRPTLSVVVPARDEAECLPRLVEEITTAIEALRLRGTGRRSLEEYEILIVDDGSADETPRVLRELEQQYPALRPIRLRANAGQSAAIAAGLRAAVGDWVAILDADLQNPPSELVKLWEALPGFDAALGWRVRREDVWSKRFISRWSNLIRNRALGQKIKDTGCAVRILPRDAAMRLPLFRGVHRFFGPLLEREGCRIVQVPVQHRPRAHGRSHYNVWNRSLNVIVDLLGVAWLLRRPLHYEIDARSEIGAWSAVADTLARTPLAGSEADPR